VIIQGERGKEKEKNIKMGYYYLTVNIQMERGMEMEKNIITEI